ncbi:HlyD family efflux transporter periplasmic adaptor subunit [candidate division GN15 bacterium]|nr:HlyD family efflux transporter periplasmic adaptor subunit [candidate division GN15 bacterium]
MRYLWRMAPATWLVAGSLLLVFGCADEDRTGAGSGLIETDEAIVSAEVSGRVLERHFRVGDDLAVGDTLATIDNSRLVLRLEAAKAGRDAAKANLRTTKVQVAQAEETERFARIEFERAKRLLESGTTTQRLFDQAEHSYHTAVNARKSAEAQVVAIEAEIRRISAEINTLERELRDYTPVAPIAGTITDDYVETGELLAPGRPIVRIAQLDTVWVKVYLSTGDFARVKLGQSATVDTESGDRTFQGTVIRTSDEAEFTPKNVQTEESRADLVYAVKVSIPNPDRTLKVGMPVYVTMDLP